MVGALRTLHPGPGETFLDLAYKYGFGYREVKDANPTLDPWVPEESDTVVLPGAYLLPNAPREGIVVNIPEMRLYYFPQPPAGGSPEVMAFPIGIGKMGWQMPEGITSVTQKLVRPTWQVPASIKREREEQGETMPDAFPPGPDNPLGQFALQLGWPGYLIHGTNKKYGIGMRVSHGCIRLYPQDIRELFDRVPEGTPVRIVNQPYKAGWKGERLYLEAHRPLAEDSREAGITAMVAEVIRATREPGYVVDWDLAIRVVDESTGIPTPIGAVQQQ
jgi:L,D-transpeptidase ErfK/SrfK